MAEQKLVVNLANHTQVRRDLTVDEEAQRVIDEAKPPRAYQPSEAEVVLELIGKTQVDWDAARDVIIARGS